MFGEDNNSQACGRPMPMRAVAQRDEPSVFATASILHCLMFERNHELTLADGL